MKSFFIDFFLVICASVLNAQSWDLTPENINKAIKDSAISTNADPFRPAFHLTPPTGWMGDPNGGIYYDGWLDIQKLYKTEEKMKLLFIMIINLLMISNLLSQNASVGGDWSFYFYYAHDLEHLSQIIMIAGVNNTHESQKRIV